MRNSARRLRKVMRSRSSERSPRSPKVFAADQRDSTSVSEIFKRITALMLCPEEAADSITAFSSPNQRPTDESISGILAMSLRAK